MHNDSDHNENRASLYYSLAREAFSRKEFEQARSLCLETLDNLRDSESAAIARVYVLLGAIGVKRGELNVAETWYERAKNQYDRVGDKFGVADACFRLSFVAQDRGDALSAISLLRKTVSVREELGESNQLSGCYHQLGILEYEEGNLEESEKWYMKSVALDEKNGDELGVAKTYHNLSAIENDRECFDAAAEWLRKSIDLKEKNKDLNGTASSYSQLGYLFLCQKKYSAAEQWYEKTVKLCADVDNQRLLGMAYFNLSRIASLQGMETAADERLNKCLGILEKIESTQSLRWVAGFFEEDQQYEKAETIYQNALRVAQELGNDIVEARCSMDLGRVCLLLARRDVAREYFERAATLFECGGEFEKAADCCVSLGDMCRQDQESGHDRGESAGFWFRKAGVLRSRKITHE